MAIFILKPIPPFRLDLTVWVLRRISINQTDHWDGKTYRRVLVLGQVPLVVEVTQGGSVQEPQLTVTVRGGRIGTKRLTELVTILEKMLGLNVDLDPFYCLAEDDGRLADLIGPFVGFKPPRLPSVFETLLNGIACQQLSMTVGMHLLNRLSSAYGLAVGKSHAFPRPSELASVDPEHIRQLGFSRRKAQVILSIAQAIVEDRLDLEGLSALDSTAALDYLLKIPGIGRWTAQYILLRGLGRLDVFPADDVGSQNKMQAWQGCEERPDYEQMYRIIAPWQPYRGVIYFYLLLNHQSRKGLFEPNGMPLERDSP